MNGQEFGEFGEFGEVGEFGEFGETAEFGEFGEAGEFGETGEFGEFGEASEAQEQQFLGSILGSVLGGEASPLSEAQEVELATELLEISNEQELEQFLGGLFKKVARGVGGFIKSPIGRALGGVLKTVAKKALPVVGGALGSMVAPGIGTAIGSKLGSMAGGLFEVELEGLPQEQAEMEVARRYVSLAATAAKNAALAKPRVPVDARTIAKAAVAKAARLYAPGVYRSIAPAVRAAVAAVRPVIAAAVRRGNGGFARPGVRPSIRPSVGVPSYAGAYAGPGYCAPTAGYGYSSIDGIPLSGRWIRRGRKLIVLGA